MCIRFLSSFALSPPLILDNEKSFFLYLIMLLEKVCSVLIFSVLLQTGKRKDESKMNTHYSRERKS